MKITDYTKTLAIVGGAGLLLASGGAARARSEVAGGAMSKGSFLSVIHPLNTSKTNYNASASVPANVETPIVIWAIVDSTGCIVISDGVMGQVKKNPDKNGTWTVGTYTQQNSGCASTTTYAAMYYTWTNTKKKSGSIDKGVATWVGQCPKGECGYTKYVIKNFMTITYAPN